MKNRNISKHESGLQVRMVRAGELYTKWFARKEYGTWAKTYAAARHWRDEAFDILGPRQRADQRSRGRIWSDGEFWHGWVRSAAGRPAATSRSINEHGTRSAKRLVRAWLDKHLTARDATDAADTADTAD